MSGIDREITLDCRHIAKHLPNIPQSNRLIRRGRSAHVFNDEDILFKVAQTIIVGDIHTGFARGYDRMQTTNTIPPSVLDPVKNNWNFLEVWVDPMQSPPYLLMLLGNESGHCQILDPAEQYKLIRRCDNYKQAQLWLLEDEYEPLEGRLSEPELS